MDRRKNHKKDHLRPEKDHQCCHFLTRIAFLFILFLVIVHGSLSVVSAQDLIPVRNYAFVRGEKFKFRAYYDSFVTGKVTAGVATLEVKSDNKQFSGRNTFHVIGEGKSKGAFNLFFKVEDRFETYIDEEYLVPWYFTRSSREGDFAKDDEVRFNQYSKTASSRTANKPVPPGIQDIISAFYFARNIDFSCAKNGDTYPINFFLDDSVYISVIQFAGREEVETDLGRFRCLKFKPMVVTGNVFSQPYPMDIWISDDSNRIPVLARSEVIVGSVKLELIHFQGLANPLTSLTGSNGTGSK